MGIRLRDLEEELGWECVRGAGAGEEMEDVALLTSVRALQPRTLYLATARELRALPTLPPLSLCLDGCESAPPSPGEGAAMLIPPLRMNGRACERQLRALLERAVRLQGYCCRLHETLISGGGPQQLLETAAGLLNNPIFLLDLSHRVAALAAAPGELPELEWESGGCPEPLAAQIFADLYAARGEKPVFGACVAYSYLAAPLETGGRYTHCVVLLERRGQVQDLELQFFKTLCATLGYALSHAAPEKPVREDDGAFLRRLLSAEGTEQQLQALCTQHGFHLRRTNFFHVYGPADPEDYSPLRLEHARRQLAQLIPGGIWTLFRDKLVLLICSDRPDFPYSEAQIDACRAVLDEHGLFCGIGTAFTSPGGLHRAYRQAEAVCQLGARLRCPGNTFVYWEFALLHLLELVQEQHDLRDFVNPLLYQIEEYDARYHTGYSETLRNFLDHGRNPIQTARALGVHRNTVDYRLGRLRELFHLDFSNSAMMFSFQLSFQIRYFLEQYYDKT